MVKGLRAVWPAAVGCLVMAALVLFPGCKDNSTDPVTSAEATQDAAESVAASMGDQTGGEIDQVADVSVLATNLSLQGLSTDPLGTTVVRDSSYDAVAGWWTVSVSRVRYFPLNFYFASFSRTYMIQFLNKSGQPQKYWRVASGGTVDTAASIHFKVVSGTGRHVTPRVSDNLVSLTSDWMITGTNMSTVTINGSKTRAGIDTIKTRNGMRVSNHTLALTFKNVTGPRGSHADMYLKTGGTIEGTYTATIAFISGATYKEKTVTRTFTVTLNGSSSTIDMAGSRFTFDAKTGEVK